MVMSGVAFSATPPVWLVQRPLSATRRSSGWGYPALPDRDLLGGRAEGDVGMGVSTRKKPTPAHEPQPHDHRAVGIRGLLPTIRRCLTIRGQSRQGQQHGGALPLRPSCLIHMGLLSPRPPGSTIETRWPHS